MLKDIKLEPVGDPNLQFSNQERPPKSGSIPDRCQIYFFSGVDDNPNLFRNTK